MFQVKSINLLSGLVASSFKPLISLLFPKKLQPAIDFHHR